MAVVSFSISPQGLAVVQEHAQRGAVLLENLNGALNRGLAAFEFELKNKQIQGGNWREKRAGRTPLASRSGELIKGIMSRNNGDLSGEFGSSSSSLAKKYAAVQLDNTTRVMVPKTGKYLAIPIADALTASGATKAEYLQGPSEVQGLKIFMSKRGNLVGFLPDGGVKFLENGIAKFAGPGKYKRGPNKGKTKGKLLFVFKKSVTVQGSDALAKAVDAQRFNFQNLIQNAVTSAMGEDSNG